MDLSRLKTTRRIANLQAGRNDWYKVIKAQVPEQPTQVMVYDEIGWFGVTAQDFINELKDVSGPIDLHLNSPGGDVFDGLAIYQFLAGRGGVTTYIDSLAASIASVIAMAGSEIAIGRNASVMIHDGWGLCVGNAADMRSEADLLDRVSDNIADVYASRTGKPVDEWRKLMLAETWFFGQEAVDAGLADRLATAAKPQPVTDEPDGDPTATAMRAHFDLSVFRNVPDRAKAMFASADGDNPVQVNIDLNGATTTTVDIVADLRKNIRFRNHATAETGPPPTPEPPPIPQPANQAPDPTDRGFSMPAGGPMGSNDQPPGIPRDDFKAWLEQGMRLVEPAAATPSNAGPMHEPYDGTHTHAHSAFGAQGDDDTHEHEHTHNGDADHHHEHGGGDGEESDADGGMRNARPPEAKSAERILGVESMPFENKALPVHHTATVDGSWDGPAAVAAMPNDDSVLRYCHAWMSDEAASETPKEGDDDADDKKGNYRFPHHKTEGGPANLAACRNGLVRLEGSKIPDTDKPGVKAHLQAHLDDADKSDDDGASNHSHENLGDAWAWDPDLFKKAMEGAQQ